MISILLNPKHFATAVLATVVGLSFSGCRKEPDIALCDRFEGAPYTNGKNAAQTENQADYDNGKQVGLSATYEDGVAAGLKEAYQKGYNAGYKKGYDEEYPRGFTAGTQSSAFSNGQIDGYADGRAAGYSAGYSRGDSDGYDDGYSDGYSSGRSGSGCGSSKKGKKPDDGMCYQAGYDEHRDSQGNYNRGLSDGLAINPDYQRGYQGYRNDPAMIAQGNLDGYADGLIDGYNDGFVAGYDQEYNRGYASEYDRGYDARYDDGYYDGYDDGYDDGYSSGRSSGCSAYRNSLNNNNDNNNNGGNNNNNNNGGNDNDNNNGGNDNNNNGGGNNNDNNGGVAPKGGRYDGNRTVNTPALKSEFKQPTGSRSKLQAGGYGYLNANKRSISPEHVMKLRRVAAKKAWNKTMVNYGSPERQIPQNKNYLFPGEK